MIESSIQSIAELRREALAKRRALSTEARKTEALLVHARFQEALKNWRPAPGACIAFYRALPDELNLRPLEDGFRQKGCRLFFPRVADRDESLLEWIESVPGGAWTKGPYGIEEPQGGGKLTDLSRLEMVFMPGVAFGMSGERIGMGAGYYDRWLATHPREPARRPLRVALAFDLQLYPRIEQMPWDLPVDWVLTSHREYRSGVAQVWLETNAV